MVRKFWLENSLGEKFLFTDENSNIFLSDPEGLGFVKNVSTARLGDNERVIASYYNMPSPQGELIFYDRVEQGYEDYDNFINFIMNEPLKFYYQPPNTLEPYYMDCQIMQLDKGEYDEDGAMRCPIIFLGTSMWLNSKETLLKITNTQQDEGKFYDLERPYHYAGQMLNNIVVNVVGNLPADFEFEIYGEVVNPILTATQNGVAYGIIKLDGSFSSNDQSKPSVYVNSNDIDEEIMLRSGDSVLSNPTSYQDLSIADGVASLTFFKLAVGKSLLSFSCSNINTFTGYINIKWKDKRVSV